MIDKRVALNLDNMRRAAMDAMSFVEGMSQDEFLASPQVQMATAMCLIMVGEAATRIEKRSPEFVASHPDWPWDHIRGLRNRVGELDPRVGLPTAPQSGS